MGRLLDIYDSMTKQAEEVAVNDERMDIIEKYASVAEELLNQEYPGEYTQEDVVKLADALIQHDVQVEESLEKIAELEDAGRVMARAFVAELQNAKSE